MANQDLSAAIEMLKNLLGSENSGRVDEIVDTLGLGGAANMNGGAAESLPQPVQEIPAPPKASVPAAPAPGASASQPLDLSSIFSNLGNATNMKNNPHVNLLLALKPYMNPVRASKIDSAMKIIQLSQITKSMGLFGK